MGDRDNGASDTEDKNCCKDWYLWGIVIILLGAILFSQIPYFKINNNYIGLILGFVGILATFIVVSNYSQVQEVKKEARKEIEINKKEIGKLVSKIEALDDRIGELGDIKIIFDRLKKEKQATEENEKVEFFFSEFKKMHSELLEIKDKPDFESLYNEWRDRMKKLENNPESKLLLKKGGLFGELGLLGNSYATSKGEETEHTKWFNDSFKRVMKKHEMD
jgi:predicted nuclease with TOPRIM domain